MDEEVYSNPTVDKAALKALSLRSDRKGLLRLAGHLGLLCTTGATVLSLAGVSWGLPFMLPALAVHGIVLVFLFAPLHETIHRTAFLSRGLNDAVATVVGAILLLPAEYFRAYHFQHHRFTQDPRRDPELAEGVLASRGAYLFYITGLPYWRERTTKLFRHAAGQVNEAFIPERLRPAIVREARWHLVVYAVLAGASLSADSGLLLLLWLGPALLGQPALRCFLLAEHTGCPLVPDMLANSRTTLTNGMLQFLCWNMNRHSAHHGYPALPFHALSAADRMLAPQVTHRSRGYPAAHREIWKQLSQAAS